MSEAQLASTGEAVLPPATVVMDDVHVTYRVPTVQQRAESPRGLRRLASFVQPTPQASVHAVRGISLVVREGESVGLIGTNGSGKSSLLRALAGLHPLKQGRIFAADEPMLLGVNAALLPELPGSKNVLLGAMALGLSKAEAAARYDEIVDLASIGNSIYLPMKTYSSGMAARLNFSIATAVRPKILLVDEALNTGDADFRQRSQNKMDELRTHAGTVFLVSHSSSTLRDTCTRVLWIDKGTLRMDGEPKEVLKAYSVRQKEIVEARTSGKPVPPPPWESGELAPVPDPFA